MGTRRWTRGGLLSAALAGGAAIAVRGDDGASLAASSKSMDADILNFFLSLEYVQERFYRAAAETDRLDGNLLTYVRTVADQERQHIEFLERQLGQRARKPPQSDFGSLLTTGDRVRDAAVELEEAAIAAYIGQAANLTRGVLAKVATLVSVEARQAAWIRDLAKTSPAPRAADPARKPAAILADLRERGFIR
jgi:rubrerythrin